MKRKLQLLIDMKRVVTNFIRNNKINSKFYSNMFSSISSTKIYDKLPSSMSSSADDEIKYVILLIGVVQCNSDYVD